jgi:predicted MFS family arabinose efflux permease
LVSNLGDAIYSIALPWYVLAHHGGALLLGTVLTAYGVPRTALLVVGGHASDRFRPWTVMLAANLARGLAVAAFAVTAAGGPARGPIVIVIAIVLGGGEGIFIPASSAIVPALLPPEELQAGNALAFGTTQLSQLAGPAVGGVLIAVVGPAGGLALDAATFVVSALTLIGIQRDAPPSATSANQDTHSNELTPAVTLRGLLARQPIVRLILLTDALLNLGSAGMGRVALPALAKGPFHLGAGGYGALTAAMGAGLLFGTITGSRLQPARRPLFIATLALLPTALLIAAIPYTGGWMAAAILLILAFALIAIGNLLLTTALQQWAPPEILGRVTGLLMLASIGMLPVSVLLAGILIRLTGPSTYFPLDAATVLIAATAQLTSPTWRRFSPRHPPPTTPGPRIEAPA